MTVAEYNRSVDDWADALYRYVVKCLGSTEPSRDIVQDCYEKLWMHRQQVDPARVKSWLFTTAHHTLVDSIRRSGRISYTAREHLPETSVEQVHHDVLEVLDKAVAMLPESQRSVLLLRDYEGYSYQEIAGITGLSESQVKVYIFRSRVFLKNYIGAVDVLI